VRTSRRRQIVIDDKLLGEVSALRKLMGETWWRIWVVYILSVRSVQQLRDRHDSKEFPKQHRLPSDCFKIIRKYASAVYAAGRENGGHVPLWFLSDMLKAARHGQYDYSAGESRLLRNRAEQGRDIYQLDGIQLQDVSVVCYRRDDDASPQWRAGCVTVLSGGMPIPTHCIFAGERLFVCLDLQPRRVDADILHSFRSWLPSAHLGVWLTQTNDRSICGKEKWMGRVSYDFVLEIENPVVLNELAPIVYGGSGCWKKPEPEAGLREASEGFFEQLAKRLRELIAAVKEVISWDDGCDDRFEEGMSGMRGHGSLRYDTPTIINDKSWEEALQRSE
jgi:hypothetical protein